MVVSDLFRVVFRNYSGREIWSYDGKYFLTYSGREVSDLFRSGVFRVIPVSSFGLIQASPLTLFGHLALANAAHSALVIRP